MSILTFELDSLFYLFQIVQFEVEYLCRIWVQVHPFHFLTQNQLFVVHHVQILWTNATSAFAVHKQRELCKQQTNTQSDAHLFPKFQHELVKEERVRLQEVFLTIPKIWVTKKHNIGSASNCSHQKKMQKINRILNI